MEKGKRVICCGNIAFDLISKGEDNKGGISFHACPGGSVFNTAIILARLGLSVSMVTKTGDDFLTESLVKTMRRENIETKYVIKDKDMKTGLAFASIDKKGDSSYLFYKTKGPQTMFARLDIPLSIFKKADVFHTGSWYSYNDYTFENALRLVKRAKKENVFTTFDPNWRGGRIPSKKVARGRINKILSHIDLLKLSVNGAIGITGAKTLPSALKRIKKRAVVTLGEKGAFYWDGKKRLFQPALKVRVADTIGAGDAFTAGLIHRYCVTGKELFWKEMKTNLAFSSALSGLICTEHGATAGIRNLKQALDFFNTKAGLSSAA
ncbi:MAG: carbohydrate kinase family protein [Candidatus Omnitrophota bacterium]